MRGVEEGVVEDVPEGAGITAWHLDDGQHVEVERFDGERPALLGEKSAAADFKHAVALSAQGLLLGSDLLVCGGEVFGPEAFVAWQFVDTVLVDGYLGVDFVGDNELLALIGIAFVDGGPGKEFAVVNLRWRLGLLPLLLLYLPGAANPLAIWNSIRADWVRGPKMPSALPVR